MMKDTNFGPLLLLLLLAVTPRNSCANPIASPDGMDGGATDYTSSLRANERKKKIEEDMIAGADILTKAMTWLKENALNSIFDESIIDLEKKIDLLPQRLAVYRAEILEGLYKSQDRLNELRTLLELAAGILKEYCDNLIYIYNTVDISNLTTLQFTADKFVEFAKYVNTILEQALVKTIEINDELSASKAFLKDFKAVLDEEKNDIEAENAAAGDIQQLETNVDNQQQNSEIMVNDDKQYTHQIVILLCTFGLRFDCTKIVFTNIQRQEATDKAVAEINATEGQINDEAKLQEGIQLLNGIKKAHKSATTLLDNVEFVKTYLTTEIELITVWQAHLGVAILENTNISTIKIQINLTGIKKSLQVLEDACDAYLAHERPNIFRPRAS